MNDTTLPHHISQQFDADLEEVRNNVLAMGGLVEQQLANALTALTENDSRLGESVITNDYKVNALEVTIDEECNRILALRQPTAIDLRLIVAIIKTITDLERIGDEAEKIGHLAVQLADQGGNDKFSALAHLGEHARKMTHDALDAFARLDVEQAIQVVKEDLKTDKEYEAISRQLITFMMEDPRSISRFLNVMWAARSLERIGDHARNICEYIIYLVKGKDVRHTSLKQMEQTARDSQ
ncbi:MAG TPA: phosphate signaling complex protein PhoU [Gammaproteobacteria bacterium]|nr:phosphate signaling complex protein PhoU [Gammaproteobacteria bacterium]